VYQYFPIMGEINLLFYYIVQFNSSCFISLLLITFNSRILLKVILIKCNRMLKYVLEISQEVCVVLEL